MLKFALMSHVLPPAHSGQAVMLHRLLEDVPPDCYVLIDTGGRGGLQTTRPLQAPVYQLPARRKLRPHAGFPARLLWRYAVGRQVRSFAKVVAGILRANQCNLLVSCSGDLLDLPVGAAAAAEAGVKFVPYFFDDYLCQWTGERRRLAHDLERGLVARAAGAIVPNEFLAEAYRQRYRLESCVVRNPSPDAEPSQPTPERPSSPISIVYTGSVYHAHYDAFHSLLKALTALQGKAVLHIYSAQKEAELTRHGIAGEHVVVHEHLPEEEAALRQRDADILFLPLAFNSSIPEVLRTSAPGKMGEYLASGRPVLVHAPADSFLSWFFRDNRCGVVVDSPDHERLAAAIVDLISSGSDGQAMTLRAQQLAAREFTRSGQRERLIGYLRTIVEK
jgi:glycosyltransferase involved in cell wall biosynthesis